MKFLAFLLANTILVSALGVSVQVEPSAPVAADGCQYWVAPPPVGDDNNPGTSDLPWATLKSAARNVPDASCTVWVVEGVYSGSHRINRRFTTHTIFKSVSNHRAVLENNGPVVALSGATNVTLEGFEFRHSGSAPAAAQVVAVDRSEKTGWAENIVLRDNIFHDSYGDDLLKIYNGVRFATVEGNVFYNQGAHEEHMDVNSVTDVVIQDNIFFNDYAGSGREPYDTKHYLVIKDSNGDDDGLIGSERVVVRRNIFLNWQGRETDGFVQVGLDGKPYHEARDVRVENNLMIGNTPNPMGAAFGVRGARDVVFANNTVTGNLQSRAYAFWVTTTEQNPQNENIGFYNNIWSDPTGAMGIGSSGRANRFSSGQRGSTGNLVLDDNLYWNGGRAIPAGEVASPLAGDARGVVANPELRADHEAVVLPRWDGSAFLSGNSSIRKEFLRLARLYGEIPADSPAAGEADPAFAPPDDLLGCPRDAMPDLGAYEARSGCDLSQAPVDGDD